MKIINRYLAREVLNLILVVVIVLLIIFLSHQFVRYMHNAALGNLSYQGVKLLLLLQLPVLLAVILPAALFFAILLAYGRLYADSEMTILNSCGVSPLTLLTTTLKFSLGAISIVALLSLWLNPKIYNYTDRILAGAVATTTLEMVAPNSFTPIAKEKWVFYVDGASVAKEYFARVFAAEQPALNSTANRTPLSVVMAENAYQKIDQQNGDLYIVLTNGYRYVGTPGTQDYEVIQYDKYIIRVPQEPKAWQADASSTPTLTLWNKRHDNLAAAELQWRIALPLSTLILAMLAVPLSKIRPRLGRYARLLPGLLLYLIYVNFLFLAKAWLKNGVLPSVVGMWIIHGAMLTLAIILIGQQLNWYPLICRRRRGTQ